MAVIYERVALIGLGLIASSVAHALRRRGLQEDYERAHDEALDEETRWWPVDTKMSGRMFRRACISCPATRWPGRNTPGPIPALLPCSRTAGGY